MSPSLVAVAIAVLLPACLGLEDPWEPRVVPSPEPVELLDVPAVAIVAGGNHSCAQTAEDTLACWGNLYLGDNHWTSTAMPQSVTVTGPVVALAAGEDLTCTLAASGTVQCWGAGSHGALGVASAAGSTEPVLVETLAGRSRP